MALRDDIARRRDIAKSNQRLSTKELCEMFDHHNIPVPFAWRKADIEWWAKAYQSRFRGRLQNVLAQDRTRFPLV